jgi:hypothetical protein
LCEKGIIEPTIESPHPPSLPPKLQSNGEYLKAIPSFFLNYIFDVGKIKYEDEDIGDKHEQ